MKFISDVSPVWIVLFPVIFLFNLTLGGVPISHQEERLGLYNSTDKVVIVTKENFKETVLHQNHSSLVEFYNSYCGHCKRFAPVYKQLASDIFPWRDVLYVCAIDCAVEENNEICREYEIMAYPTLRYFDAGFTPEANKYGIPINTQELDKIRSTLATFLAKENQTNMVWHYLQPFSDSHWESVFEADKNLKYLILVYEPENSTVGIETALHFLSWPNIKIQRLNDLDVGRKFQVDGVYHKIATLDRSGAIMPYKVTADTVDAFTKVLEEIFVSQNITERPITKQDYEFEHSSTELDNREDILRNKEIIKEVHKNRHLVYQADLEMAVRGILHNEIPKSSNISGERLIALQRFLHILQLYNPILSNGHTFISKLYEYVKEFKEQISGKQFEEKLKQLESELSPVFSSNRYIGCTGSQPTFRGFTCSLWQLFHYLSVQSANSNENNPLEVLEGIHGYIKNFFGCSECSTHFQEMAQRRKMWDISSKDEAVLWLWSAHNEVNQRLSGDATEDPEFPKVQFPLSSSCPLCYNQSTSLEGLENKWNKDSVLKFFKNIYNPQYISRYGIESETLLYPTLPQFRQKRMIGNVFSDIDLRMGMLLYGFCIAMMVVAFKLFVFKGYRKKAYCHDLLGKV